MARQIIILETNPAAGGEISVRAVFWYPVTPGEEVPTPNPRMAMPIETNVRVESMSIRASMAIPAMLSRPPAIVIGL